MEYNLLLNDKYTIQCTVVTLPNLIVFYGLRYNPGTIKNILRGEGVDCKMLINIIPLILRITFCFRYLQYTYTQINILINYQCYNLHYKTIIIRLSTFTVISMTSQFRGEGFEPPLRFTLVQPVHQYVFETSIYHLRV